MAARGRTPPRGAFRRPTICASSSQPSGDPPQARDISNAIFAQPKVDPSNPDPVGGVVAGGEPLMRIVPEGGALYLEAQVPATRIDQIRTGQEARVGLYAFKPRTMPN